MPGANKKPWQQKGTGKARHGSRLAPQWMKGGVAHGPRLISFIIFAFDRYNLISVNTILEDLNHISLCNHFTKEFLDYVLH